MCQNAFFPCLQGINMLRSKREEQKTDVKTIILPQTLIFPRFIFATRFRKPLIFQVILS